MPSVLMMHLMPDGPGQTSLSEFDTWLLTRPPSHLEQDITTMFRYISTRGRNQAVVLGAVTVVPVYEAAISVEPWLVLAHVWLILIAVRAWRLVDHDAPPRQILWWG